MGKTDQIGQEGVADLEADHAPSTLRPDDRERFAILYRDEAKPLERYIAKRVGVGPPEPEDVAQQVFEKLAAVPDIAAIANPGGYLKAVARNIILDHHRSAKSKNAGYREFALGEDNKLSDLTPEYVLAAKEQLAIVLQALDAMPKTRRRIFMLVRIEGHSVADVAQRFLMSEAAVYQHVSRAAADCTAALRAANREISDKAK